MEKVIRFVRPIKILGQSYVYARKCVEQNDAIDEIVSEFKRTRKVKKFLIALVDAKRICNVQQARISQLYNDTVRSLKRNNPSALEALIEKHGLPRSFLCKRPFSENYIDWPDTKHKE